MPGENKLLIKRLVNHCWSTKNYGSEVVDFFKYYLYYIEAQRVSCVRISFRCNRNVIECKPT